MKLNSQIKSLTFGAAAAVIASMGMFSSSVQAAILTGTVSLSNLFVAGNSYQIGDRLLDNFRDFLSTATGGASAITTGDIFVTVEQDDPLTYRLIFQSGLLDVTGTQTINTSFAYDVVSISPQFNIVGASIELTGAAVLPPGIVVATNTFTLGDGSTRTISDTIGTPNLNPTTAFFATVPSTRISIAKNIFLDANGGEASLSFLDQTVFDGVCGRCTQIPESSSVLGLLTLGGLGITVIGKKVKSKFTNVS